MHLHIDCQFGMAGDMLLAALVDAGADLDAIRDALRRLPLEGFALSAERTARGGVAAMLLDVGDLSGAERPGKHTHDHDHKHAHEHAHNHDHGHSHGDKPGKDHEHGRHRHKHDGKGGPHRHLGDLLGLLDGDAVSERVRKRAGAVFRILGEAEATVHGMPLDEVHFHEISGIDTAVDVIGVCIALDMLEVESVSAAPLSVGSGMVMCEHGIFPVPAPATLQILKAHNVPWRSGGEGERATPTGAALLAGLAETYGDSPEIIVTRIGYGAGHREFPDVPNLLRVLVGKPGKPEAFPRGSANTTIVSAPETEPSSEVIALNARETMLPAEMAALLPGDAAPNADTVVEFRFAVDDMTPEALAFLCERCLAAGALEAYAIAATMKKGRAGHEVTVLANQDMAGLIAELIWRESSTFGIRVAERSRLILPRDMRTVAVLGQKIRVKLGWLGGKVVRRAPEYEDCRAAALATGAPLSEVFELARREAAELL